MGLRIYQDNNGKEDEHTDSSSQVNGAKHLNGEIRVHLPYELCSIAGGDMGFLVGHCQQGGSSLWGPIGGDMVASM